MRMKFENGSNIESIGSSIEGNTRSKRDNDYIDNYIERFSQNDNSFFNPEDIKPLDYKELDGKTLKMMVVENEGIRIIAGQDLDSRKIYMISCERCKED